METNIGKKVIIRGDRSGVEFGTLVAHNGREVTLHNARRIWYWAGAASLSQLAQEGTSKPQECKFTVSVDSITIPSIQMVGLILGFHLHRTFLLMIGK